MKFTTTIFQNKDKAEKTFRIDFDYVQGALEMHIIDDIRTEMTKRIVDDIYPDVKAKLMDSKNFQRIINEINLLLAKKYIN